MARFWPSLKGRSRPTPAAAPRAPEGEVVYAVGDIHGRSDLLETLLDRIGADAAPLPRPPVLVFLGDYVDRGATSREVLQTLAALKAEGGDAVVALKGNHEEALLGFLQDPEAGASWVDHGGRETLASYGVTPPRKRNDEAGWAAARDAFAAALPDSHLEFLKGLQLCATFGDYMFVHAGVRPGVPLDAQAEQDLLWIRDDFLNAKASHGKVIVHGHTPTAEPEVTPWRIGVDTGAYATGVLTAVRLERDRRDFVKTGV